MTQNLSTLMWYFPVITRRSSKWLCLVARKNISLHFDHKHTPIFKCLLTAMRNLSEVLTESSQNKRHFLDLMSFLTDKCLKHHFLIPYFFPFCPFFPGFIKILIFISYISTQNLLGTFWGVLFSARKAKSFQDVSRASARLTRNLQAGQSALLAFPLGRKCSSEKVTPLCSPA